MKNGKKTLKTSELRRKAMELRTLGLSYQQIADQIGCSKSAAHKAVMHSLNEVAEEIKKQGKQNIALDLQRLDWIIREAMKLALKGDLHAMDRILKAIDRRAKIFGYDAPQKIAHTTPDGEEQAQGVVVLPSVMELEDWLNTYQAKEEDDS